MRSKQSLIAITTTMDEIGMDGNNETSTGGTKKMTKQTNRTMDVLLQVIPNNQNRNTKFTK